MGPYGGRMRSDTTSPTDAELAARYAHPAGSVRANMVQSLDGRATIEGRVGALTGPADQRVLSTLRQLADVVLVGAGTIRAEGYGPLHDPAWARARAEAGQAPAPRLAIVSNSGYLPADSPALGDLADPATQPILIVPDGADVTALAGRVDVMRSGSGAVDLDAALTHLRGRGLTRVLCEGGPQLLADLVGAELVDELCLTLAPVHVGAEEAEEHATGSSRAAVSPTPVAFALADLWSDDGYVFTRYVTPRGRH